MFNASREAGNIFKIPFDAFAEAGNVKKFFGALRAPGNISKTCSARLEKLEIFLRFLAPGNISKICSARLEKLKIFLRFFGTWKYFKDLFSAFREAENIFKIFWHLEIFQRFVQRVQRSWKYFKKFFGALKAPGNISKTCSARLEKLEIF